MSKTIKYPEVSLQNLNTGNHSTIKPNSSAIYPARSMSKPPSNSFYIPAHLSSLKKTHYKSPESSANQSSNASPSPRRKYETSEVISYAKNALSHIKDSQKLHENASQMNEYLKKVKNKMEYYKIKSKNLEKENLKLKEDIVKYSISDSSTISGSSERWEKSSGDEFDSPISKLEESLKTKYKSEISNLKEIINEKDKKIKQMELELQNRKFLGEHKENIKNATLEKVNIDKSEHEKLEIQFKELEDMQNRLISENETLKRELKIYNSNGDHLGLIYFANDIRNIKKDLSQVLIVLETLKEGKQVSLKLVLGLEDEDINPQLTAQQINQNLSIIKSSLSKIREIIADFHAEQCGTHSCAMQ
ncbi:unnamed protein product [Blepharisma stoltei]|uniref:Uncharacterized protein n=1 Tax=Blepharisma stoltei TaxID=1481888 RepID=A0AAU9K1V2_9CILI|nr:unnamed protein product [Blepharisma stoltei]